MVWELDGPGPILKNSSMAVITGPLARFTTARSGETLDVGVIVSALTDAFSLEQPVRMAAAAPVNAARVRSRRLMGAEALVWLPAGAHEPHAVAPHEPQPPASLLSTVRDVGIV